MKSTLLLTDEAETIRLMLKDVASDELPVRNMEAHAGCNCDRWGHHSCRVRRRDIVPKPRPGFITSRTVR